MYASCRPHTIDSLSRAVADYCRGGEGGGADCPESGNAASAGGGAAAVFGFCRRPFLRAALDEGAAGCSSATTGFGSILVEAEVVMSPTHTG